MPLHTSSLELSPNADGRNAALAAGFFLSGIISPYFFPLVERNDMIG